VHSVTVKAHEQIPTQQQQRRCGIIIAVSVIINSHGK